MADTGVSKQARAPSGSIVPFVLVTFCRLLLLHNLPLTHDSFRTSCQTAFYGWLRRRYGKAQRSSLADPDSLIGGNPPLVYLTISLLPFPFPPLSLPPLRSRPLNTARESGEALYPSGVWGGAPAEVEFGAL